MPDGIYYAELLLEVSPLSKTSTGVAVYASTVATVKRHQNETVPAEVDSVTLVKYAHQGRHHPARRVLHGDLAATVVDDFNALQVDPGRTSGCRGFRQVFTARFVAAGHTWVASMDACPSIKVTRGGTPLPDLDGSAAFSDDLIRLIRGYR